MKKETAGDLGVVLGWLVGYSFLILVIPKIVPIKVTANVFLLMYFMPIVYFLLSKAVGSIVKDLFPIETDSKARWGVINFLMSLLSPIVIAVWVAVMLLCILVLVFVTALSLFFPSSVEFEFQKKDEGNDREFISAFYAEAWKHLRWQENDLPDGESGDPCYDAGKDTFSITLYGDITRKAKKALTAFAECWGYKVVRAKIYR